MKNEKEILLKGYVSKDAKDIEENRDNQNSNIDDCISEVKENLGMISKIQEQINILNNNPNNYDIEIYDDLISYNNKRLNNVREKDIKRKEIKNNIERLKEQKKQTRIQMQEFKKKGNIYTNKESDLTKLQAGNKNKFNYSKRNNENEPLIKKKQRQKSEEDTRNREISQRRAELFYGDENYNPSTNTFYLKAEKNSQSNLTKFPKDNTDNKNYIYDISNPEKLLFPKGTLAQMPLMKEPLDDVKKEMEKEKEKIIRETEEKEVNLDTLGTVKLKEILPDIEKYIPPVKTKDEKRAEIIYKDMKEIDDLKNQKDRELMDAIFECIKIRLLDELKSWIKGLDDINNYNKIWIIEHVKNRISSFKDLRSLKKFVNSVPQEKLEQMLRDYLDGTSTMHSIGAMFLPNAANILEITEANKIPVTEYTQYADIYNSPDELPDKYKSIIKEKLKTQNLNENAAGLYFYSNSPLAQSIVESTELKNKIKKVIKIISSNPNENINENDEIKKGLKFGKEDLYMALNKVDIRNLVFAKDGTIEGDIIDTTDFNSGDNEPNIVKAAKVLQDEGRLKPKFVIVHFVMPKEKVDKIMKETLNETT